jgi:hypothetical protein
MSQFPPATTNSYSGRKPVAGAPDPTFAKIDAHRRSHAAFRATAEAAVGDVERAALNKLLATKPMTIAGAAASLRYILDHSAEECGRLTDWFEEHDDLRDYLETLAKALEALAHWPRRRYQTPKQWRTALDSSQ